MSTPVYAVPAQPVNGFRAALARQSGFHAAHHTTARMVNGNMVVEAAEAADTTAPRVITLSPTTSPGEDLLELVLLADALHRCSPAPVVCVLEYLPYSRSCRLTGERQALGARAFIRLLESAPIDRFYTFDLHAGELLGFFSRPVSTLSTLPLIGSALGSSPSDVVVGPDRGRYDDCRSLAATLGCSFDLLLKVRVGHTDSSRLLGGAGEGIADRRIVLFDDEITRGETALHAIDALAAAGAEDITFATVYDFAFAEVRAKVLSHPSVTGMVTTNLGRPAERTVGEHPAPYTVLDAAPLAARELGRHG
ncbi:ribose-phosphate diphosphokinase [Streptomyces sp. Agncl-13]|uniref:ribose-phosphate diphosphokinase n=1 Tax=Streptomyces sp. Agncl-13 TaxID=3400628 RepID=UPI003A898564